MHITDALKESQFLAYCLELFNYLSLSCEIAVTVPTTFILNTHFFCLAYKRGKGIAVFI
jgi:hypothetical protein